MPQPTILQHNFGDIVGKRVLCIPKTFYVPTPSPVELSSSLWSTTTFNALTERHDYLSKSASDPKNHDGIGLKQLSWCNKHHHHQSDQQNILSFDLDGIQQNSSTNDCISSIGIRPKKSRKTNLGPNDTPNNQQTIKNLRIIHNINCDTLDRKQRNHCQLCELDKDSIDAESSANQSKLFNSLPWRLGTIRAVSHRDLGEESISIMIEFDLLDWKEREWYHIHDRSSEDTFITEVTRAHHTKDEENASYLSTVENLKLIPKAFSVLLIESSLCLCQRRYSPTGRYKLWPALLFEPLIDDLNLFGLIKNSKIKAIEYIDPTSEFRNNTFTQPTRDINEMIYLKDSFCDLNSNSETKGNSFTNKEIDNSNKLFKDSLDNTESLLNNMQEDCSCWSPRVEFVDESYIYKYQRSIDNLKNRHNTLKYDPIRTTEHRQDTKIIDPVLKRISKQTLISENFDTLRRFLKFSYDIFLERNKLWSKGDKLMKEAISKVESNRISNDLLDAIEQFPRIYHLLKELHSYQEAQSLLLNVDTAALVVGNRVKVYRCSGTTQWYTAVIISYDEKSFLLTLVDDTVLEEHQESPALLEMHLLDDGLVESIIEGDNNATNSGTSTRRRTHRTNQRQAAQTAQLSIMNSSPSSAPAGSGLALTVSGSSLSIPMMASNSTIKQMPVRDRHQTIVLSINHLSRSSSSSTNSIKLSDSRSSNVDRTPDENPSKNTKKQMFHRKKVSGVKRKRSKMIMADANDLLKKSNNSDDVIYTEELMSSIRFSDSRNNGSFNDNKSGKSLDCLDVGYQAYDSTLFQRQNKTYDLTSSSIFEGDGHILARINKKRPTNEVNFLSPFARATSSASSSSSLSSSTTSSSSSSTSSSTSSSGLTCKGLTFKLELSNGATIDGKNFLSHRLRLEALADVNESAVIASDSDEAAVNSIDFNAKQQETKSFRLLPDDGATSPVDFTTTTLKTTRKVTNSGHPIETTLADSTSNEPKGAYQIFIEKLDRESEIFDTGKGSKEGEQEERSKATEDEEALNRELEVGSEGHSSKGMNVDDDDRRRMRDLRGDGGAGSEGGVSAATPASPKMDLFVPADEEELADGDDKRQVSARAKSASNLDWAKRSARDEDNMSKEKADEEELTMMMMGKMTRRVVVSGEGGGVGVGGGKLGGVARKRVVDIQRLGTRGDDIDGGGAQEEVGQEVFGRLAGVEAERVEAGGAVGFDGGSRCWRGKGSDCCDVHGCATIIANSSLGAERAVGATRQPVDEEKPPQSAFSEFEFECDSDSVSALLPPPLALASGEEQTGSSNVDDHRRGGRRPLFSTAAAALATLSGGPAAEAEVLGGRIGGCSEANTIGQAAAAVVVGPATKVDSIGSSGAAAEAKGEFESSATVVVSAAALAAAAAPERVSSAEAARAQAAESISNRETEKQQQQQRHNETLQRASGVTSTHNSGDGSNNLAKVVLLEGERRRTKEQQQQQQQRRQQQQEEEKRTLERRPGGNKQKQPATEVEAEPEAHKFVQKEFIQEGEQEFSHQNSPAKFSLFPQTINQKQNPQKSQPQIELLSKLSEDIYLPVSETERSKIKRSSSFGKIKTSEIEVTRLENCEQRSFASSPSSKQQLTATTSKAESSSRVAISVSNQSPQSGKLKEIAKTSEEERDKFRERSPSSENASGRSSSSISRPSQSTIWTAAGDIILSIEDETKHKRQLIRDSNEKEHISCDAPNQLEHQQTTTILNHHTPTQQPAIATTTVDEHNHQQQQPCLQLPKLITKRTETAPSESRQTSLVAELNSTITTTRRDVQKHSMVMHNFGPNSTQKQQESSNNDNNLNNNTNIINNNNNNNNKKQDLPLQQNNLANLHQQLQQHFNATLGSSPSNSAGANRNSSGAAAAAAAAVAQMQLHSQQQNYGSYNSNNSSSNSTSSTSSASSTAATTPTTTTTTSSQPQISSGVIFDPRIDQIIRNTLYDSIQLPKSISIGNIPSPSSSIMFNNNNNNANSSSTTTTTPQQTSQSNSNGNIQYNSSSSSISAPSPVNNSIYGSNVLSLSDSLNNNNVIINNNNNDNANLSTIKTPAHLASHSVLAAAAALQSLNQSHTQRSRLAQQQQTPRPPSNSLPSPSLHVNNNSNNNNLPKLGITSTTSSNHQNHNHLALLNQQQLLDNNPELAARFQQQQQKMSPGVRPPPINWQDQAAASSNMSASNLNSANNTRGWLYNGPPFSTSGPNLNGPPFSAANITTGVINNLSNSNNMIGQDGDNNSARLKSNNNDQRQPSNQQLQSGPGGSMSNSNVELKILSGISSSIRQPHQWNDNSKGFLQNLDTRSKLPSQRGSIEEVEERLIKFLQDLAIIYIPGTTKQKRLIIMDSVDDLKQSILRKELYTKFEDIIVGVLTNQYYLSDFQFFDYIRQDKFSMTELERMDSVHRRLGILDIITFVTGRQPLRSSPNESSNNSMLLNKNNDGIIRPQTNSDNNTLNNLNINAGIYQQQQLNQLQAMKNAQFLQPVYPGSKQSEQLSSIEKNRRLSQSPSDILSQRSQFSNGPNGERILMAHSSSHQNNSTATNINAHLPSASLVNQRSSFQLPPTPHSRSSPFIQAPGVMNTYMGPRPPRANSILGIAHEPPLSFNSTPLPRQPPAAHQSSTARSNLLTSATNLGNPTITGPPVSAHMSSRTPQTLKTDIQSDIPMTNPQVVPSLPPSVFKPTDSHMMNRISSDQDKFTNSNNFNLSNKIEMDSAGMPVQTLLTLKQQEMVNKEMLHKGGGTPVSSSGSPMTQHTLANLGSKSPGVLLDPHSAIKSPMSAQQLHSIYNSYPQNLNNGAMLKLQQSHNLTTSMPPPSFEYNKINDMNRFNDTHATMISPNITNDAQLKQYSALLNAYQLQQQQQSGCNKNISSNQPCNFNPTSQSTSDSNPSAYNNSQGFHPIPQQNFNEAVQIDIRNNQSPMSAQVQVSPKQNVQRSIITGTASIPQKRNKKASKNSPTLNNSVTNNTTNDVPTSQIDDNQTDKSFAIKLEGSNIEIKEPQVMTELNFPLHAADAVAHSTDPPSDHTSDDLRSTNQLHEESKLDSRRNNNNSSFELLTKTQEVSIGDKSCNITNNEYVHSNITETDDKNENNLTSDFKNNNINAKTTIATETSKYQKIYTKKAWLKNYDQEDQAKSVASTAIINNNPENNNSNAIKEETTTNNSDNSDSTRASDLSLSPMPSQKSTNDKQVRKMPSRKVKPCSEKDDQRSFKDKDIQKGPKESSKKRGKKDKSPDSENPNKRKLTALHDEVTEDEKRDEDENKETAAKRSKKTKLETTKKVVSKNNDEEKASPRQLTNKCTVKKKNGDRFLQTDPCYDIVPKNIRCLECRRVRQSSQKNDKVAAGKQSKTNWDDFCRFYEFRKLRYNKASQIIVAGFSDLDDANESDKILYSPHTDKMPKNISLDVAKFILKNIGDDFCKLVMQERAAIQAHNSQTNNDNDKIIWKRAVNGLRELCDVCSTTLFNCHYVCERCGFVVCIDCYLSRSNQLSIDGDPKSDLTIIKREQDEESDKSSTSNKNNNSISNDNGQPGTPEQSLTSNSTAKKSKRDSFGWIYCAKNEEHSHDKLFLTQIIAGDCLEEVWKLLHHTRQTLDLGECCCRVDKLQDVDGSLKTTLDIKTDTDQVNNLLDTKQSEDIKSSALESESIDEASHSTLKGLLLASNLCGSGIIKTSNEDDEDSQEDTKLSQQVAAVIEGCISSLPNGNLDSPNSFVNHSLGESERTIVEQSEEDCVTPMITVDDTHSWLCQGELLVLNHANHEMNLELFRRNWIQGKPVLVRSVGKLMQVDMWLPQYFGKQFSEYKSDLVDCRNGDIHRHSMKRYWEGFEPTSASKKKTNKDDTVTIPSANNEDLSIGPCYYVGAPLWRLKDWPPGQDFNEILPNHYDDFMNNLPLRQYTTRGGELNLACRLPKEMLKPDLGPKMYSAYGTPKFPERGTTNLHLDISDAINVMVYVSGATSFQNGSDEMIENYNKTLDECVIDPKMKQEIKDKNLIPGAMWHIFKPSDVEKMREFLNKVADERNISLERRTDPIHDQTWYLDQVLLDRLEREHGVKSYAILQCMGDAIIIPAGSPHQVKNVQNCIKVANDFVSPENVRFCLKLTNEFRSLPETHINQEDKLQIKNILYHSVKESLQYIELSELKKA